MKAEVWHERIIQKHQPSEPTTFGIEEEPEWVGHLLRELTQQSMPALPFRTLTEFAPQDLGRLIGQQRANFEAIEIANWAACEQLRESAEAYDAIARDAITAAWNEANDRDRAAFFRGLAEGLSMPGIVQGSPARATTATTIYQILFVARDEVKRLKSVRELREFLLARGLTAQSLGEPKRLEKLCQRIGLSFSEPGRPKRTN